MYERVHRYTKIWNITPRFSMSQITDNRHLGLIKWIKENTYIWNPYTCIRRAFVNEYTEILDWISCQGYRGTIRNMLRERPDYLIDYLLIKWAYNNDYINKKRTLELVKRHTYSGNLNAFEWGIQKSILVHWDDFLYLLQYEHVLNTPIAQSLINLGLVTLKEIERYHIELDKSRTINQWWRFDHPDADDIFLQYSSEHALQKFKQSLTPGEKKSNDNQLESLIHKLHKISKTKSTKYVSPKKNIYHKTPRNIPKKALSNQSKKRPKIIKYHHHRY